MHAIARSRSESAGRVSIAHASTAARSAVMPLRPGRPCTCSATSSVPSDSNLRAERMTDCVDDAGRVDRSEVAEGAHDVGASDVLLALGRQVDRVARSVDVDSRQAAQALRRVTMTSIGSSAGRGAPQRYADERWDAIAPCPTANTAAMIRCSTDSSVPTSRATPGCIRTSIPLRIVRRHAWSLSPVIDRVTTP